MVALVEIVSVRVLTSFSLSRDGHSFQLLAAIFRSNFSSGHSAASPHNWKLLASFLARHVLMMDMIFKQFQRTLFLNIFECVSKLCRYDFQESNV